VEKVGIPVPIPFPCATRITPPCHEQDQGRTGKFEDPVRNNGLGPSGLVQDREYQAIAAGKRDKRDVLCESTNVRSHTCNWQLNHHKRSNNYFFVPE